MSYRPYSDISTDGLRQFIRLHEDAIKADPHSAEADEYHEWMLDALRKELEIRGDSSGETVDEAVRDLEEQGE